MTPKVLFNIRHSAEFFAKLDPALLSVTDQVTDDGDEREAIWNLEPARWHLAPRIQAAIEALPGCHVLRHNRIVGDEDPWDASLVVVRPDRLPGARILAGAMVRKRCRLCEQPYVLPPSPPDFTITLPSPILVPGLFTDEDQTLKIVSEDVLAELGRVGLDRGLQPIPLTVEGHSDRAYFALHAPTMVFEAQPWGSTVPNRPCHECGRRSAAHLFFPLYERPSAPLLANQDWFHGLVMGPTMPLVTKRVADWMRGEGKDWVGKPMYGKPPFFVRCGWDPDDRLLASLPERFRGASLEPVEPLRPDEYPLPWPPPRSRRGRSGKAASKR